MDGSQFNSRTPIRSARDDRDDHSETPIFKPDPDDDRSRSPQGRESRDRRGRDEGHRGREEGPELLNHAVIAQFTDVVGDRQRDIQVTFHQQLITEEKQKLGVWLRQSGRATDPSLSVTTEDFSNYLNAIFENWSSESAVPNGPSPLDRTTNEVRIEVGTLKVNAPLSEMESRKGSPTQKPARLAGQPVFCGITINYETDGVAFTWKDRQGARVPYDIISFRPGLDRTEIYSRAIDNYDHHELQRVRRYNSAIVVACARRAIKAWAERGTDEDPDFDIQGPQDLQTCVFAGDRVEQAIQDLIEVSRLFARDAGLSVPPDSFGV